MFDQGFQILNRIALDAELATLFRRWDATPNQRAEFVNWAWVVAAAADSSAMKHPRAAAAVLRNERESIHRLLAETLHSSSTVNLHLVSKRMFLDWLTGQLLDERVAA